jgi:hypothetical protein
MIPRTIHQVWLGTKLFPAEFGNYRDRTRELHPDWQVCLYRDEDVVLLPQGVQDLLELCHNYSEQSDVLRWWYLLTRGGVYMDTDMELFTSLGGLCCHAAWGAVYHDQHAGYTYTIPCVVGSVPEHAFVRRCWELTVQRLQDPLCDDLPSDQRLGVVMDLVWHELRHPVHLLPSWTFFPYHHKELTRPEDYADRGSLGCHHWAGSWTKT